MFMDTKINEGTLIIVNKKTQEYCFLIDNVYDEILDEYDEIVKHLETYSIDVSELEQVNSTKTHTIYFVGDMDYVY